MHEAGDSVEEGRNRGLRPDMEFQLSPHSQMFDWNRQSVSILATPSRTLKKSLLARPQDLSLIISPCVASTWFPEPLFILIKKRKEEREKKTKSTISCNITSLVAIFHHQLQYFTISCNNHQLQYITISCNHLSHLLH